MSKFYFEFCAPKTFIWYLLSVTPSFYNFKRYVSGPTVLISNTTSQDCSPNSWCIIGIVENFIITELYRQSQNFYQWPLVSRGYHPLNYLWSAIFCLDNLKISTLAQKLGHPCLWDNRTSRYIETLKLVLENFGFIIVFL